MDFISGFLTKGNFFSTSIDARISLSETVKMKGVRKLLLTNISGRKK
jgi:hypothetical protein